MASIESPFQLDDYYINYLRFIENKVFKLKKNFKVDIIYNIEIKSRINYKNQTAKIGLIINIFDKSAKYPFYIELSLTGIFVAEKKMAKEDFQTMCDINAPAILLPFARTIIATVTSQSGYPVLNLPLVNIHKTIKKNKSKK